MLSFGEKFVPVVIFIIVMLAIGSYLNDKEKDAYSRGYDAAYEQIDIESVSETQRNEGYRIGKNEGYEEGYSAGYDAGHEEGYSKGEGDGAWIGYSDGYDDGYEDGYLNGYENGLADAIS